MPNVLAAYFVLLINNGVDQRTQNGLERLIGFASGEFKSQYIQKDPWSIKTERYMAQLRYQIARVSRPKNIFTR